MKVLKTSLVLASALLMSCAGADNGVEATIRKNVEPKLGEDVKIDAIRETPYAGLYEIRIGNEIRYTDKTGTYLFVGHVFSLKTSEDLTQARIDDISKIKFSDLPLELALKTVKGDGKRVIAVFEDPNCGYCKRFRQQTLAKMDNITVYTFMYNILSPDSLVKSKNIWCSADRNRAWDDWMVNNKPAPSAPAGCVAPNDKVLALGRKLGVQGTPALFFADGSRVPGAIDMQALEEKLATIKK
ncbi:thiol:disulfide interchange protein DsbC [Pseudoduganella flava]|uniref:Thiol:disulfide interchange protein n=1 Tax=Pseudoduganella flava TaxID=871742 RepID=A0A562PLE0_9BURK|nr:DsbC family protein [Pseudoduganella flava]QGZ41061.1 thioredoxin fold domain-containing protein [Pseudoduganella flava]TWI45237.1 thiol:disulfide interchange protein DsbC [Pseudoduganella flava]